MKEKNSKKKQRKKCLIVARSATKGPEASMNCNKQLSWAKKKAEELNAEISHIMSFN